MLQQTTVAAVRGYYERFLERWPTVEALADATLDQVLHAWQGLGYYQRARNLHACAQVIAVTHGGRFPETEASLRLLPGVGPYTAAAIAAIAHDQPIVPVDANVERVVARLFAVNEPLPAGKKTIALRAAELAPTNRPGDFAQALMDLGASICSVKAPSCNTCPLTELCEGFRSGRAADLPVRPLKKPRPTRFGVVFWLARADGAVLIRQRPPRGLLGGMYEVPSTLWREEPWNELDARREAPTTARWQATEGLVKHTFTHFHLELRVWVAELDDGKWPKGVWTSVVGLADYALPTVMKKVVGHVVKAG